MSEKIQSQSRHYSFAHNMQNVLRNQVNELALLNAINEAMSTDKASVTYTYEDQNGNQLIKELPSYATMSTKVKALESTINRLQTGAGYITSGNVKAQLTIKNVPETPTSIDTLTQPTTFDIDSNWFFEQFMFPGAVVDIDLSGTVSQKTENVEVCRIMLDAKTADAQSIWTNELSGSSLSYSELIARLENAGIRYYEDRDTIRLPWTHNVFAGKFNISDDPVKKNDVLWYPVDTLEYSAISEDGFVVGNNKILSPGDELLYGGAVFKVSSVDATNKMVSVTPVIGAAWPGAGGIFQYYKDPASTKHVRIRFGVDEYNFIYIRPISPDYGIVANTWSKPIVFASNDLVYKDDKTMKFKNFYDSNISDWGAEWVAHAKEKPISAYKGVKPNAPTLYESDFKIVQINTHLSSAVLTDDFKVEYADLVAQKREIQTLCDSVSSIKGTVYSRLDASYYATANAELATKLSALTVARQQYSSMSDSLFAKYELAEAVVAPKYRVRGFFGEPAPVYINEDMKIMEEIIGYDIQYRYKTVTGGTLPGIKYTHIAANKATVEAVFSDWQTITSKIKERKYNAQTGSFEWETEFVSDGSTININQIDLPITKNESIEFRVRAISEAGYPNNPLKSDWSNSVTIAFDTNKVMSSTSSESYVENAKEMVQEINVEEILRKEGLLKHIEEMYTVSGTNTKTYMHSSDSISYADSSSGYVNTISLTNKIKDLETKLTLLEAKYNLFITNQGSDKKISGTIISSSDGSKLYPSDDKIERLTEPLPGINPGLDIGGAYINPDYVRSTDEVAYLRDKQGNVYSVADLMNQNAEYNAIINANRMNNVDFIVRNSSSNKNSSSHTTSATPSTAVAKLTEAGNTVSAADSSFIVSKWAFNSSARKH